jgi:pimeloyl-ACP methyl ester carboxylesterase
MPPRITKHFVTVGSRRVHYHRAGEGPAVVLLHASACSAKVMQLPLEVFATRFTALAFDTPGFGLSDLLQLEQPEIADFADALAETLDALDIEHTAVYGRHTGAQIAVEFAARHPDRCAMALTDGYPLFSGMDAWSKVDDYLQPLRPTFDGAHLVWAWFRYRDQHVFWPWNEQRLANRGDTDVPDLAFLHRGVIELIEAGDSYRVGYAAAFRHRGREPLARLRVPVCFGGRPGDSLYGHLKLLPEGVWTQEFPRDAEAAARAELSMLLQHRARGVSPPPPPCAPLSGRSTTEYVDTADGQILVRTVGDLGARPPVVIVHHAPGSSALHDRLVCALGAHTPVLALDLPGHGESEGGPAARQTVEAWAVAVQRVLDVLRVGAVWLYGHNGGGAVAVEMALRMPDRVRGLILDAPICLTGTEQVDIAPRWLDGVDPVLPTWNGEHLLRAWHMRRDMALWWPWYDRGVKNIRHAEPRIDPAALTIELREVMKQPASFTPAWRAATSYPMRRRLSETTHPCLLMTAPEDLFSQCLAAARGARPDARGGDVEDTAESRARAIHAFVSRTIG